MDTSHRQAPVFLYTKNLNDEAACTMFSSATDMSALLRHK